MPDSGPRIVVESALVNLIYLDFAIRYNSILLKWLSFSLGCPFQQLKFIGRSRC
jgi:hypothetical protein